MINFTTNTYQMKREIVKFSKKICEGSKKPILKFVIDMIYGISKSKDILLSSIADALDETTKKANTINRLSDNLAKNLDESIDNNYCDTIKLVPENDVLNNGDVFGSVHGLVNAIIYYQLGQSSRDVVCEFAFSNDTTKVGSCVPCSIFASSNKNAP